MIDYKNTQPYRLGVIYRQLADMLMDERTDMRDLEELGMKLGFKVEIEIVPDEDSRLHAVVGPLDEPWS